MSAALIQPDATAARQRPAPPLLAIRGLGKNFDVDGRTLPVLADITLDVAAGEFIGIVGASGCGKSTLLRLLIGLDTDYTGSIMLDGRRIEGPGADRSIAFQEHRLFPWLTVSQNIGLGLDNSPDPPERRRADVEAHIELVGLAGFGNAYPHQLSGGMAQRAAIARALVSRPRLLLLDEPLGALDSLTRAYLQEELLRIWQQQRITVVMVTHDVEEALYLGDRIVVMEPRPGRIRSIVVPQEPRPRQRTGRELAALRARVLDELRPSPRQDRS